MKAKPLWHFTQPALPVNSRKPAISFSAQRPLVAGDPAVEPGGGRHECPLVGRDRLGEIVRIDLRRFGKGLRERAHHGGVGGKARNQRGHRLRHLVGRFDRTRDLLLEAARAAVPEHRRRPGEIPQGRRVTLERTAGHAAACDLAVGEALAALVTACTGQAAVDRQPLVVKQRLAERALFLREWIVGGKRHRAGRRNDALSAARSSGACAAGAACSIGGGMKSAATAPIAPPAKNAAASSRMVSRAGMTITSACRRQARCARRRRARRHNP